MEERISNELEKEGKQSSRKWKSKVDFDVITSSVLERTAIGGTTSLHNVYKLKEPFSTMAGRPTSPHGTGTAPTMPTGGVGTE